MKGGRIPIHIMRWAPADYVNDPVVKLALAKRDLVASTFYPLFLFHAFMEGGSLPADPILLAAIVGMKATDVRKAVAFFVGHGKLREGDGRLFHERVIREVKAELEFRELQSERGKLGGRPKKETAGLATEKPPLVESESPPCAVRRAPTPTPITDLPTYLPTAREAAPQIPPEQRAEDATKARIRHLQLELGKRLTALVEHPRSRRAVHEWCREVTSYEGRGGSVKGVSDYRTLASIDRLERSIEDAEWWFNKLETEGEPVHGAR